MKVWPSCTEGLGPSKGPVRELGRGGGWRGETGEGYAYGPWWQLASETSVCCPCGCHENSFLSTLPSCPLPAAPYHPGHWLPSPQYHIWEATVKVPWLGVPGGRGWSDSQDRHPWWTRAHVGKACSLGPRCHVGKAEAENQAGHVSWVGQRTSCLYHGCQQTDSHWPLQGPRQLLL